MFPGVVNDAIATGVIFLLSAMLQRGSNCSVDPSLIVSGNISPIDCSLFMSRLYTTSLSRIFIQRLLNLFLV